MKKISIKQSKLNREVSRIKATKPDMCVFCGNFCGNGDGIHLMNKQIYPQYYTEPLNIWKAHRWCHNEFDASKAVRAENKRCIDLVRQFATYGEIFSYFGI